MSRKGNCWDNAPAESLFHSPKTEHVYHRRLETREQAQREIFERRKHSTLGYRTPVEFEQQKGKAA
jgi:transposase InsO family protein